MTLLLRDVVPQVAFKSCAPIIKCTTLIDRTTIDDAEEIDLVMPIKIW